MRIVVALAVLVSLTACSGEPPVAATTAPPSTTAAPSPPERADPPPEPGLADLPVGRAPDIGYVDGTTYVAPDGTRTEIPSVRRLGVAAVARLGDGFLVQRADGLEGTTSLALVEDGRVVRSWNTTSTPVVGRAGEVAWCEATTYDASVIPPPGVWLADDDTLVHHRIKEPCTAVGVQAGEAVVNEGGQFGNESQIVRILAPGGEARDLRIAGAGDLDERGSRVLASVGNRPPAVLDLTARSHWHPRIRVELVRFSPSGHWVLGKVGHHHYVVLNTDTGDQRTTFDLPSGTTAAQLMWESDRAVLIVAREHRRTAVVRATLDGAVELALPITTGHRGAAPGYVLEQRP